MAKHLKDLALLSFDSPTSVEVLWLQNSNPQRGHPPVLLLYRAGSWLYLHYSLMSFEVPYLNFIPCVVMALIAGFAVDGGPLDDPIFGSLMAIFGALPCAYLIGICVDDLSHQLGLLLGAILNSIFLTIVELILYALSLLENLGDVVRSAVTGCFLMNLLIIPGVGMLAAGVKWHDVKLNKKAQSISGTFLFLSVTAVLFPSIFAAIHRQNSFTCIACNVSAGETVGQDSANCTSCRLGSIADPSSDPLISRYEQPLMISMAVLMPIIYIIGVFFSLKTHSHIYEPAGGTEVEHGPEAPMSKKFAIGVLISATVVFSLMAHVLTDKIPVVINQFGLSQRFVGLVFYTLIPNAAEYMNAIKFALAGNLGLSMEIGNQGAILTALIEMPALVLVSFIVGRIDPKAGSFSLVFPLIDVFCVIVAVILRNSILSERSVNYFTGISFLLIFVLISVVYFFEFF
jgi:Ca2+:H+ antiporter